MNVTLIWEWVSKNLNSRDTIKSHLQKPLPANQLKAKKLIHIWDFLDLVNQKKDLYDQWIKMKFPDKRGVKDQDDGCESPNYMFRFVRDRTRFQPILLLFGDFSRIYAITKPMIARMNIQGKTPR
jgi:hypothetical protein